jgi:hypothetical protein
MSENIFPEFSVGDMPEEKQAHVNRKDPMHIVCPFLTAKLGREQWIRHPSFGWWESGEYVHSDVPIGESCLWRRDVDEKKICTDKTQSAYTLRLISEYGSTRDAGGWTRYMVMYEEGTKSPYPFTHDCTSNVQ